MQPQKTWRERFVENFWKVERGGIRTHALNGSRLADIDDISTFIETTIAEERERVLGEVRGIIENVKPTRYFQMKLLHKIDLLEALKELN